MPELRLAKTRQSLPADYVYQPPRPTIEWEGQRIEFVYPKLMGRIDSERGWLWRAGNDPRRGWQE